MRGQHGTGKVTEKNLNNGENGARNNCWEDEGGEAGTLERVFVKHLSNSQQRRCSYIAVPERGSSDAAFLWPLSMPLFTQANKDRSSFSFSISNTLTHAHACFSLSLLLLFFTINLAHTHTQKRKRLRECRYSAFFDWCRGIPLLESNNFFRHLLESNTQQADKRHS